MPPSDRSSVSAIVRRWWRAYATGGCHPTGATIAVRSAQRWERGATTARSTLACVASTATSRSAPGPGVSRSTRASAGGRSRERTVRTAIRDRVAGLVPAAPRDEVAGVPQAVSHASSRTATRWSKVCSARVRGPCGCPDRVGPARLGERPPAQVGQLLRRASRRAPRCPARRAPRRR